MSFPWANHYKPSHPFMQWLDEKLPLPRFVYNAVGAGYPVPRNLNYFWNFGILAGVCLMLQIVTGVILAMHYAANTGVAFDSTEHIMRDVNWGWMLRYAHANGASAFFVVVYVHIFRGFFFSSYKAPREMIWLLGVVIFLLMMATAFMGYVLPWGQMSFWGAKVITGLFGAIPLVGEPLQQWLLGGFSPDQAALNRFFSLHFLLPFVILGVVILHVWALHIPGSSNPTGVEVKSESDTVPFHPYYTAKDGFGLGVFLLLYCAVLFFAPNALGHPDNYIPANPMSTPAHIVPEWYFWPFYAILRAFTSDFFFIPAKLMGVLAMFSAILVWFFLPWLDTSPVRSGLYRPLFRKFFYVLLVDVLILGYCGGAPAAEPYVMISQIAATYYFLHFLVILPLVSSIEKPEPLPYSITEAVLGKDDGAVLSANPAA
ncbi:MULTISPECIES: cytochrome b/b6 [unclassified Novosphingobium]|jgi:ubiquinol-cytochrome c reductase cytochrome b subunit|uniref:cytochrome b n=1 Tax=unclassified Novosphingobium TaxID=2644732 RepID=UPI00061B92D4|nr:MULTISPECIES: cytochrome b/b6 [unclassified Novosphingobium]MBF5089830.1 cytochrome b/b6 [Novosphingobium sp. NBM11]QCI94534.1 cytochrome b/b6 [Novosphingobium sp. EMRT-2]RQW43104.1 cytochrome b/b6 [Novosphingobium sp. LASN5T]GAO53817.1 ubiquinol--cytochrome c reductase, cytochrome B subunit [Novosphingobium sp. MD-1]